MNDQKITTSVLPGFMELLPADQIRFDRMKAVIEETYRSFGFLPLDTPAIERSEVLLSKAGGETEKQIYRFTKGDNDLSLRFDLTVPLARYVSEHANDLNFPFRRYHIAKVYRGEKPQKGRFREFYQCDIDVVGRERLGLAYDAELLAVIYRTFSALQLPKFVIRISNRKLLVGLLESIGLSDKAEEAMRIIDKMDKVSLVETKESLKDIGLKDDKIKLLLDFVGIKGEPKTVLDSLAGLKIENRLFTEGLAELSEVILQVAAFDLPVSCYGIDLAIARGLDYYTGTVYETILLDYPKLGSICSGGRYDSLASNYGGQALPGVGISIGLSRLFYQLRELGLLTLAETVYAKALVIPFDMAAMPAALAISMRLREAGIAVETYLEEAKFKNKLSYANKSGVKYAVIIGEDEVKGNFFTVKDMESGEQEKLNAEDLVGKLGE